MLRRRHSLLLCMGGASSSSGGGPAPPPTYGERARFNKEGRPLHRSMDQSANRHVHKKAKSIRNKEKRAAFGRNIYETTDAVRAALDSTTDARALRMAQLTDQIFSKGASFVTSACNITFVPDGNPSTPEVAFIGRQRVGKTALLRSLFKDRYAVGHSNTAKRKDAMSFFNVGGVLNVVECPGYGSRSCPLHLILQHAALIRNFVRCRPSLKMLYYCMDVNKTYGLMAQDVDLLKFLSQEVPNFTILITKGDLLSDEARVAKMRTEHSSGHHVSPVDIMREFEMNGIHHPMLITSAYSMGGIDTLRYDIVSNCLHALPTEMLTYNEASKLSQRLLTQAEIATVRPLQLAPTERDDEEHLWGRELAAEQLTVEALRVEKESATAVAAKGAAPAAREADAASSSVVVDDDDDGSIDVGSTRNDASAAMEVGSDQQQAQSVAVTGENDEVFADDDEDVVLDSSCSTSAPNKKGPREGTVDGEERVSDEAAFMSEDARAAMEFEVDELLDLSEGEATGAILAEGGDEEGGAQADAASPPSLLPPSGNSSSSSGGALAAVLSAQLAAVATNGALAAVDATARSSALLAAEEAQRRNFASLTHKLENKGHLAFIRATSPWRNPLLWPANVIPTRSRRHNIMRCPDDPSNPYLTQPRFVAPRMDMYFRRPSSKTMAARAKDKGLYHADSLHAQLDVPYTIPYFPTIQDIHIMPKPQHFVGISKFFSGHGEGRLEGLLALKQHRDEMVNPLGDTSTIANPMLRAEVERLEARRYGAALSEARAIAAAAPNVQLSTGGANNVEASPSPGTPPPTAETATPTRRSRMAFLEPTA